MYSFGCCCGRGTESELVYGGHRDPGELRSVPNHFEWRCCEVRVDQPGAEIESDGAAYHTRIISCFNFPFSSSFGQISQ